MEATKAGPTASIRTAHSVIAQQEVRCAVRFPLVLPILLSTDQGEITAVTSNVSASGVQFEVEFEESSRSLPLGLEIRFALRMPGEVLGTGRDVLVQCTGRVVRCIMSQTHYQAAATIDEYQFAEQ
jgi:hypothetical protein